VTRSFTSAATLDDALAALGTGARPVAGGTDLVVGARQGKAPLPDAIVAIDRIESLTHLDDSGGGLRLGALVTHEAIVASEVVRARFTALADASAIVGSHATRANGTIGGNVISRWNCGSTFHTKFPSVSIWRIDFSAPPSACE